MTSFPRISIITPSFNQASFIEENIRSILSQQYPSIEHIVIDGGSTDGTIDILKKYPHLRWISEPDPGQSHALNKGFRMAKGEIIGWLNADDCYCADIFQDVSRCFDDPSLMVVYGSGYEIDSSGDRIRPLIPRGISAEDFIRYWTWRYEYIQPAFFFRISALEDVGFVDENLHYTMDHDLFIRLILRYDFHYLQKPLACFRLHESSKTGATFQSAIPKYVWELQKVSRRYWGAPTESRYYRYLFSFIGALFFSAVKNIFFVPGSKSRNALKQLLRAPMSHDHRSSDGSILDNRRPH